jgi:hypothetical protein
MTSAETAVWIVSLEPERHHRRRRLAEQPDPAEILPTFRNDADTIKLKVLSWSPTSIRTSPPCIYLKDAELGGGRSSRRRRSS